MGITRSEGTAAAGDNVVPFGVIAPDKIAAAAADWLDRAVMSADAVDGDGNNEFPIAAVADDGDGNK